MALLATFPGVPGVEGLSVAVLQRLCGSDGRLGWSREMLMSHAIIYIYIYIHHIPPIEMAVLGSRYPDIVSYFPFNKGRVLDSFQTHGKKLAGQPWMSTDFNLLLGYSLSKIGHDVAKPQINGEC